MPTPDIDEHEEQQIEQRIAVSAPVVHEAIRHEGERELKRPTSALAWSGFAAGLTMSFSFVAEALLRSHLAHEAWRPLVAKMGYPLGFILVIIGRQQLFTENTLTPVLVFLSKRDFASFAQVIRLWTTVLISNLAGAHVIAWVLGNTPLLRPEVQQALSDIGHESAAVDFPVALLRGIFAGWLIALVVWLLAASEGRRVIIIALPTYIVGLAGFTHVIVGSIEVLFLVMTGSLSWTAYFVGYCIPALVGNVIGGVSLVSALNHAQVVSGK